MIATVLAEDPSRHIVRFCGKSLELPNAGEVWCEAEPLSTRNGNDEGNTVLDLAVGHVSARSGGTGEAKAAQTTAGIRYGPIDDNAGWVCFVEAKVLSDCGCSVTHDPFRNQLTRVIENLLCFQASGSFPPALYFALLTPRVFRDGMRKSRMYGYKMEDYKDRAAIAADIAACSLRPRTTTGYCFPDIAERVQALAELQWATYEEILADAGLGYDLDIVRRWNELSHIRSVISEKLARYAAQTQEGAAFS